MIQITGVFIQCYNSGITNAIVDFQIMIQTQSPTVNVFVSARIITQNFICRSLSLLNDPVSFHTFKLSFRSHI